MMYETIMADIKTAMKEKDVTKKDVLKQVQTKAQADAKEHKVEISDEIVMTAINKEIKQLNQTLDAIKGKEDSELYKSTVEKLNILKAYLPAQLSEDEVNMEVQKILAENSSEPKGKLTGIVMKTLKGKADNKIIKACIDKNLK